MTQGEYGNKPGESLGIRRDQDKHRTQAGSETRTGIRQRQDRGKDRGRGGAKPRGSVMSWRQAGSQTLITRTPGVGIELAETNQKTQV